jgi:S-(hydroxymethyl)glutathione dehydrogenase/alcohol dehydrogenase
VLTGSHGGDCVPDIDIPRIIKLHEAGRMSFDGLITHEFSLDHINEAIAVMRSGEAGRILVNLGEI